MKQEKQIIEYADWSTEIPEDWNKIAFVGPYKLEGGQGDWSGISLFNPTWLDIWKACDKSIMALGLITVVDDDGDEFETPPCDHIFIEEITAENGVISIHFGSQKKRLLSAFKICGSRRGKVV